MKIEKYAKKLLKKFSKVLQKNSRLLSFIINMIKTERKNISLLRGYENAEIQDISAIHSQKSVDSLIASAQKHFNLVSQFYKRKNKF